MKIDITKSNKEPIEFKHSVVLDDADVLFECVYKKDGQFLLVDGKLSGKVKVVCDISGKEFYDVVDEQIAVKFISGIYDGFDQKYDIIELDSDYVDLGSFVRDEIESFRLGFHRNPESKSSEFQEKEF